MDSSKKQFQQKEKKNKFEAVFKNAPDPMFIHDLQGNFLEVNEAACKKLGYSKNELLKMGPADIDTPEYASQVKNKIKELKEKGEVFIETEHVTKDGKNIPVELNSKIIDYKGEEVVLSVARDISDRKTLSKIQKQSKTLLDLIPSAVFTVDENRRITSWNKAAEKISGFSADEMIGHECLKFALSPCNENCGLLDKDIKKPVYGKECIVKCKDGKKIVVSKNVGVLKNEKGDFIGGVESFEDLSKIKKTEKKIKEKVQELEKINKLMVGREEKMIELKEKIKKNKK
ncbi:MAG: PAS domain S-box protein [Candidatus Moraniibacteriota bacterium]